VPIVFSFLRELVLIEYSLKEGCILSCDIFCSIVVFMNVLVKFIFFMCMLMYKSFMSRVRRLCLSSMFIFPSWRAKSCIHYAVCVCLEVNEISEKT
jgi:hypothetical protein